jgi:chitinase
MMIHSFYEIAAAGIPLSKIVVGKPASTYAFVFCTSVCELTLAGARSTDAGQGNMDPGALGQCLPAAQAQGWSAGLMVFQFPRGNAAWISSARGSAFPV